MKAATMFFIALTLFSIQFAQVGVSAPNSKPQIISCTISQAEEGGSAKAQLSYTNTGESSAFYYTLLSQDYAIKYAPHEASVKYNEKKVEEFDLQPIAGRAGIGNLTILLTAQSGKEISAQCSGEISPAKAKQGCLPIALIALALIGSLTAKPKALPIN